MAGMQAVDAAGGQTRLAELAAQDRDEAAADEAARPNSGFTQVYPKGWARMKDLLLTNPTSARLYMFLAENMDPSVGAICVSQELMAEELGVTVMTIRRLTKILEAKNAVVRIRVGTGVYAYALDPTEVWKSWNTTKATAAFTTRTLVKKADRSNGDVRRRLQVMFKEAADASAPAADAPKN